MVRDTGFEPVTPTVSTWPEPLGKSVFPRGATPYDPIQIHVKPQSVTEKCDKANTR